MVAGPQEWGNPHCDHPAWDRARLRATALLLPENGQVRPERFPIVRVPFDRAYEVYEMIDKGDGNVLKVVLTY